jgi:hypothetical protein
MKINIFFIIFRSVLLRMRMFQTKVVEKIETHILLINFFSPKNRAICDIMWKNIVEPGRSHMTI